MREQDDYVTSGGGKKPNNPNSKKKIAARQKARKESGLTDQKFFVKTRMEEMAKRGKVGDRKALRKKFQSGDVSRKGFNAPKKKSTGSTGSTGKPTTATPTRVKPTAAETQQMLQRKRRYYVSQKP